MSDQRSQGDLDAEWKPNGRPQSTMARNFSATLNSAFAIDDPTSTPELSNLAQSVSEKKAALDTQTSELQALEARIREMDKRLEQKRSRTSSPAGRGGDGSGNNNMNKNSEPPRRSPLSDTTFSSPPPPPPPPPNTSTTSTTTGGGGSVNAPGAAGNYYGASASAATETTDGLIPPPAGAAMAEGGRGDLSASTRGQWMPASSEGRGVVTDGL